MSKILEAYFLAGIFVTLLCFACGKHNSKSTDVGQHTTDKSYNQLQHLTDDDTLITTVEKPPPQHIQHTRAHQAKTTDILVTSAQKIPSKLNGNKQHRFRKEKLRFTNKDRQFLQKVRHSKNWLSRIVNKNNAISKKVIRRKSRDDGTYDDENIQSKDEDEDEDVQLIIIPRKPRKHLPPKVQDADENDNEEIQKSDDAHDDSENNDRISENAEDSENSEDDSENSENSRKDSKKPYFMSKNFRQRLKNYKHFHRKSKSTDDDATLTLERVAPETEDDDDESKNKHQSDEEDYDIHLKVKDKSGTRVKLSGDLPGKIENLMAVGEDGGEVQIKNTRKNSKAKSSEDLKIVNSQGGDDDSTTDEIAQNLLKIKSGKLKHSPYPSTILLKTDGGVNENPKLASEGSSNQRPTPLKTRGSDEPQALPANTLTSLTRDETNAKAGQPANQQPSNNIFSPMEFENGDDELMATSRLLDIAQKADDVSSLKDVKDPSNTVKEQPKESLKDLTKGVAERQTSKAFLKSAPMSPDDYKKQSEDIDKESDDNWYKMQSLEDRVVNEGSSAKTGKDVGSYNGQKLSLVSPSQLQLLQTEYPSYPAYLTPLLRTTVKNE